MSTRLVLNELDLDLSSLSAWLVVVIIVVVGLRSRSLHAARWSVDAVAVLVLAAWGIWVVWVGNVGHGVLFDAFLVGRDLKLNAPLVLEVLSYW